MQSILSIRACRFRALHEILTGPPDPGTPRIHSLSNHLARDVGLPEQRDFEPSFRTLGSSAIDLCSRLRA